MPPSPSAPLNIGQVLAATLGVLRRGWFVILPLIILLEWLPGAVQLVVYQGFGANPPGGPYGLAALSTAWWLFFPLADMAVVMAVLAMLNGRRPSFAATIGAALLLYPVALGLDLPQNLISLAQSWLFVGPPSQGTTVGVQVIQVVYGLATAAVLLPSLAVAGQERLGLVDALVRSIALTQGNRLRIAMLALMFMMLQMLVEPLLGAIISALLGGGAAATAVANLPHTLIFAIGSASQAMLYWRLVRIRDGAAPGEVDDVFG